MTASIDVAGVARGLSGQLQRVLANYSSGLNFSYRQAAALKKRGLMDLDFVLTPLGEQVRRYIMENGG